MQPVAPVTNNAEPTSIVESTMTMQTNTLPFQITGANATAQRPATPDRLADAARSGGSGGFSATLNREMATRQPAAAPPQPAARSVGFKRRASAMAASSVKGCVLVEMGVAWAAGGRPM